MKKLGIILIILGVLIACYPKINNLYGSYQQQKLISQWEAVMEVSLENSYRQIDELFLEEYPRPVIQVEESEELEEEEREESSSQPKPILQKNVIGTIEIKKINLHLPILKGTTENELSKGAGHMIDTSLPGEVGNCVIAGHRGHSYGRLFNRLDELKIGDKIIITTQAGKFQYTVYEKKVVEPTDLSVLKGNDKDKTLTLITCTPLYEATHRLIIHSILD